MPNLRQTAAVLLLGAFWAVFPVNAQYQRDGYHGRVVDSCTALLESGDYAGCRERCELLMINGWPFEEFRQLRIRAMLAEGLYEEAGPAAAELLSEFPDRLYIMSFVHEIFHTTGMADQAEGLLKKINAVGKTIDRKRMDVRDRVSLGQTALRMGAEPKMVLDKFFEVARKEDPKYLPAHLAAADLALAKSDHALASKILMQAQKSAGAHLEILYRLALAFFPSDREKAFDYADKVLKKNPRHSDTMLLRAEHAIDVEKYGDAAKALEEILAINTFHPRANALSAALDYVQDQDGSAARDQALKYDKTNPEVDFLIGSKICQKRRFKEGLEFLKKSLAFDSGFLPAKAEMGQNLLRLGREVEGWKLIEEVQKADPYNVTAYNLMLLHDHLENFTTIERENFVIRMEPREAEVYGERAAELLERAREQLCTKYGFFPEGKVVVEFFPQQEDFAIRTLGIPGGLGILGACFGQVITMNSPGSLGSLGSNWESTLWHEFCHTVTLGATNNRIPRWFTEGFSVYEETRRNPACGRHMNPQYRRIILREESKKAKKVKEGDAPGEGESELGIIPISELSAALTAFSDPERIDFAYYEARMLVEYLIDNHGLKKIRSALSDIAGGISTPDALEKHVASLEKIEKGFHPFLKKKARALASGINWAVPGRNSPLHTDAGMVAALAKKDPNHFWGLTMHCVNLQRAGDWEASKKPARRLIKIYPGFHEANNAYTLLARAHRNLEETKEEIAVLRKLAALSPDDSDAFTRLLELDSREGNWAEIMVNAKRQLAVNPLLRTPHRALGLAAQEEGKDAEAVAAFRTLLKLDPANPADVHWRLGTLLAEKDPTAARMHAIQAVEEAPRFRDGHRLLLRFFPEEPAGPDKASAPDAESDVGPVKPPVEKKEKPPTPGSALPPDDASVESPTPATQTP